MINAHPVDNAALRMRVYHSSSVYDSNSYKFTVERFRSNDNTSTDVSQSGNYVRVSYDPVGNQNYESVCAEIKLYDPSNSTFHKIIDVDAVTYDDESRTCHVQSATTVASTNAITGVRFYWDSGNFDSGTIKLYGVN